MRGAVCLCLGINYFLSEVGDNWSLCTRRPQLRNRLQLSSSPPLPLLVLLQLYCENVDIVRWRHVKIQPHFFFKLISFFFSFQTGERTSSWESVGKKCFGQCKESLKFYDQPKVTLGTVSPRAWITHREATYHPGQAFVAGRHHEGATQKKQPERGRGKKKATDE